MATTLRLIFTALGVLVIVTSLTATGPSSGLDGPIWGILLGLGLIFMPGTAIVVLLGYLLVVGIPLGLALLFAKIAYESFGEGLMPILGLIAGGVTGYRVIVSDAFLDFTGKLGKRQDPD